MNDTINDLKALMAPLDPASRISDQQLLADAPPARTLMTKHGDTPQRLGTAPRAWTRKRVLKWTMPALVVAIAGGTAAAAALHGDKTATVPNTVRCFAVDHTTKDYKEYADLTPASNGTTDPQDPSATVHAAVTTCGDMWHIGLLIPGNANNTAALRHQDTNDFPVPNLLACVLESGEAAVFPSNDAQLCQHLGLAQLGNRK